MSNSHHVLKRPLILTEKGNVQQATQNKYTFEVALDATKHQIRAAITQTYPSVRVLDVHTMIVRGHSRRMGRGRAQTKNWKKAIVTLREGDTIEHFQTL